MTGTKSMATETNAIAQKPVQWWMATKDYFEDLRAEMRRVTWPSWKQVRATTLVVIGAVFAFAAYFGIVDFLVGRGITKLFDTLTK
ncbi:MAG: preprotein translocase subunit SecE [Bryobacteraceae bacterium]|nr:preprotein translocase subunit SecE [Bryobacteraceae bacterium]